MARGSCYGAQPGLDLGRFPGRGRLGLWRRRVLVLSHEPALLQQPVDHYPVRSHHVAPGPPRTLFVEHRPGYAQRLQGPSGVRLSVGQFVGPRGRVSAPKAVHRVVVEPDLVPRRFLQPVRLQYLVDPEPVVGTRVEHGSCGRTIRVTICINNVARKYPVLKRIKSAPSNTN